MEYLQHFGLTQDPFSNDPDLRFYFESESHRDAQRRIERSLRQRKGLTLLTGDGGIGKTLLVRRILEALEEEIFEAIMLVMLPGAVDGTGILQRFARQLGTEAPANDRAELLGQIYEQLSIVREDGRHAVLMIDDAQVLSPDVFAELGGLLNLEYEDRRLMSVLFVGSSNLDALVENDPSMAPRVDVRVRLQPLDMANTTSYLEHRLAAIGASKKILPAAAIEALYKFGRGRPRLLNTLADNALFECFLAGRKILDPVDVERSAADLGIGTDPGSTFSLSSVPPSSRSFQTPPPAPAPPASEDATEFELTSEVASAVVSSSATLDLDAGLEAALEDFDNTTSSSAGTPDQPIENAAMEFDVESVAPTVEAVSSSKGTHPGPEMILEEVEITPLDDSVDVDELDEAFVELIEE